MSRLTFWGVLLSACSIAAVSSGDDAKGKGKPAAGSPAAKISFDKQVRPILQAKCLGCHQPAKAGGGYVMTAFESMLKGGESEEPAITPGKPAESRMVSMITPHDGKAEMPQNKPPLAASEIELINQWIAQGAKNDAPRSAQALYDMQHPPVYTRLPVIPALAYSPDGAILAVAGFHEVLLWKADGSEAISRLVGLSERVESLAFSPDGKRLAVAGGRPARMGEIQVWDVAKRKLLLSTTVTYDTTYGASWSPDGSTIAFGCGDNTLRAINSKTGEQVLFMGSHNDWVLDTVFSVDGSHLISVGRDMSAKLTEFKTERFVDNITSITPGALKGGLASVARHPRRDEIVIGGSDGQPKVYRVFRQSVRVIGDDSNLIRELPGLPGRVYSVAVSGDGKRIAAAASLDGAGEIAVYGYEFDTALPDKIKAIQQKVVTSRSQQERDELEHYHKAGVKEVARIKLPGSAVYAVAFAPDGKRLAAAGSDGMVRLYEPETGKLAREFAPVPVKSGTKVKEEPAPIVAKQEEAVETETLPKGVAIASLSLEPGEIRLSNRFAYAQIVATARTTAGASLDVTRMADFSISGGVADISRSGLIRPRGDGKGTLKLSIGGKSATLPVTVLGLALPMRVDYVRDVAPLLSKLGCNQGTCHGSAQGKNGFKLSLRGYDPLFDVRALTDDHAARRINLASPDLSLMLLKPTGAVPHVGGAMMTPGEPYYEALRSWITDGARLDTTTPRVSKIELFPANPVIDRIGLKQQFRVLATYANGTLRDVTREAFLESANTEVAAANRAGLVTSLRRGEAPVLARYEGNYASTTVTVMGDRSGFVWAEPPRYSKVDELVAAKWKRLKILPSGVCSDAEFVRRVTLDLTGLPPTADQVRKFLADPAESRQKREALVDALIGTPEFVDYWTNKWADLLQVNRKFLGVEGAVSFRNWIRKQIETNTPYDVFVSSILTAAGSNRENPAAAYFKILRDPTLVMENTTQLFLAVRFNCNKCHDHPFERWTQDQYYQTAAYFAQVGLKADPESKGRMIGGTDVESPKPLFEIVSDATSGEVVHDRTKKIAAPRLPFDCAYPKAAARAPRRQEMTAWLTSRDNPYFARSYVNRLWGYLFGVGIIEPLDDIRAGNPPSNPELLDYLTKEFIANGFNVRRMMALICKSRTYQLAVETNRWNSDDKANYSHAVARRLPAEVLLDAVYRATGSTSTFPGVPAGTRAAALPDSGVELPSGFLTTFGRPARESACECERTSGLQLGPVMALVSGPTLADAIADPNNAIAKLVATEHDDSKLIQELFLRVLNRPATPAEVETCRVEMRAIDEDHRRIAEELGKRETEYALRLPALESKRRAEIAAAETALADYEKAMTQRLKEQEKVRAQNVAKLKAELAAYDAGPFAKKAADWEKAQTAGIVNRWAVIEPKIMSASNGATLRKEPDGSITVHGPNRNGVVTITAETDLTDIAGVRLEVLTDPRLPQHGPGRATDGNFVLNEFAMFAAPRSDSRQKKPVKLVKPLADFTQANFDIARTVDGDLNNGQGWAVAPATGMIHWATFETAAPVGAQGGSMLTFVLHHRFNEQWTLGRFRISVTRGAKPIGLSLPEEFRAILATAPEVRTAAQREQILHWFRGIDADRRAKEQAIAAAAAPPPVDPRFTELRAQLEQARRPIPVDPALVSLRHDLQMSVQQIVTKRLTAAQDVAWALFNSPAFLFNH